MKRLTKKLMKIALMAGMLSLLAAAPAMAQESADGRDAELASGCSGAGCWPLYSERDTDTDVKSIKYLLRHQGFADYNANDAYFGPLAVQSVNAFKSAEGLPADGTVDGDAWRALVTPVSPGQQSEAVSAVQVQLSEQYGYHLPVTGFYGQQTENAVKDFQRQQGLPDNGKVGVGVWRVLVATA